jgi:hypothetical protein
MVPVAAVCHSIHPSTHRSHGSHVLEPCNLEHIQYFLGEQCGEFWWEAQNYEIWPIFKCGRPPLMRNRILNFIIFCRPGVLIPCTYLTRWLRFDEFSKWTALIIVTSWRYRPQVVVCKLRNDFECRRKPNSNVTWFVSDDCQWERGIQWLG